MEKANMHSLDMVNENIKKIGSIFPECVTETVDENGNVKAAIDFEKLQENLSHATIGEGEERYQFTWPGKREAIHNANAPTNMTLRPCKAESVDFDNTENLYIEGDNLEVLKLLQENYLGKVKMIYIDPPYNTGNDFVYNDNFTVESSEFRVKSGMFDEDGNMLLQNFEKNTESNGRFHTDWLNMMYPRLKIARNLLSDDGVIFISIDDNEVENLKKICNEVFGESNFEGHIHWRRRHNQPNDKTKTIGIVTDHILVYAKDSSYLKSVGVGKLDLTATFTNPDNDPRGPWASKPWKVGSDQSGSRYTIVTPTGIVLDGEWMGEEKTYKQYLEEGRIYFPKGGDGMPRKKYYQFERENEGQCATNWWTHEQFGHNQGANDCMTKLFGAKNVFSNPKPLELLRAICKISNLKKDDISYIVASSFNPEESFEKINDSNYFPEPDNKELKSIKCSINYNKTKSLACYSIESPDKIKCVSYDVNENVINSTSLIIQSCGTKKFHFNIHWLFLIFIYFLLFFVIIYF